MGLIDKELRKFSAREQSWIKEIIAKLVTGQVRGLDIQKLKGTTGIFRARKGDIRIIYRVVNGKIFVLKIARRSEKTYQ